MPAEGEEMRVSDTSAPDGVAPRAAALLERLRAENPRVHCITNAVAQNFTANVLLAAGCTPSMTLAAEEIAGFVAGADALLVNLGTLDPERRQATETALAVATERRIPWVLDPVFVDRSPGRAEFARALLARRPTVVRLNHAEFKTLAECAPDRGGLEEFAADHGCTVALSGQSDLVGGGGRIVQIDNGHPLMARVTAMGCAGSALVAACLAVASEPVEAAAAALLTLGIAGELAAERSAGPGSFASGILDALYTLDAPSLVARARCA
jgi:hydroxyethylthiazole kinase